MYENHQQHLKIHKQNQKKKKNTVPMRNNASRVNKPMSAMQRDCTASGAIDTSSVRKLCCCCCCCCYYC
jgi:hypothetical protein